MARWNHSGGARSALALVLICAVWFVASARPAQARVNVTPAPASVCNRLVRDEYVLQVQRCGPCRLRSIAAQTTRSLPATAG